MELLTLFLGVLGGGGGAALFNWLSQRRSAEALTKKITAEAKDIVYESYRDLIDALRKDAEMARAEAADARAQARDAQRRAAEAEMVAASAVEQAAKAAMVLVEVRRLVAEQVPDADDLLRQIEKLAATRRG